METRGRALPVASGAVGDKRSASRTKPGKPSHQLQAPASRPLASPYLQGDALRGASRDDRPGFIIYCMLRIIIDIVYKY